ncbi:unnamed protein product [Oikopleura dioica]|uniref:MULE transposase domain-containing protein n=1 Tax=Oikopleura dioica TaxID=34765 RepID=E4XV90_OIKDI|nr:unnamed protein product [Oikopleura dioica]
MEFVTPPRTANQRCAFPHSSPFGQSDRLGERAKLAQTLPSFSLAPASAAIISTSQEAASDSDEETVSSVIEIDGTENAIYEEVPNEFSGIEVKEYGCIQVGSTHHYDTNAIHIDLKVPRAVVFSFVSGNANPIPFICYDLLQPNGRKKQLYFKLMANEFKYIDDDLNIGQYRCYNSSCSGLQTFWCSHGDVLKPREKGGYKVDTAYLRSYFQLAQPGLPIGNKFKKRKEIIHRCRPYTLNQLAEEVLVETLLDYATELQDVVNLGFVQQAVTNNSARFPGWVPKHDTRHYMMKMRTRRNNARQRNLMNFERDPEFPIIPKALGSLTYSYEGRMQESRWCIHQCATMVILVDLIAIKSLRKRLQEIIYVMIDGTFLSSGAFRQLLTIMLDIQNDIGVTKKTLVYAVYTLSKNKDDYKKAFEIIFKHLCAELGVQIQQVCLQVDAECGLFLAVEEIFGEFGCSVITTICSVHLSRSNWYNCRRYLSVRTAPSEARLVLYYLQVLIRSHPRLDTPSIQLRKDAPSIWPTIGQFSCAFYTEGAHGTLGPSLHLLRHFECRAAHKSTYLYKYKSKRELSSFD